MCGRPMASRDARQCSTEEYVIRYIRTHSALSAPLAIKEDTTQNELHREKRSQVKLGISIGPQKVSWKRIETVAILADNLGYDSLWLFDHILPLTDDLDDPVLETWTLMSALAHTTERLKLGTLVTCNTLRAPALLAKIVMTVDHISQGRAILGLGAGYYEPEHRAYGIDWPPRAVRAEMLDEACQIVKGLWRADGRFSFDGEHYQLHDAPFSPPCVQPSGPPLLVGGAGMFTLRTVARYADQWDLPPGSRGTTPADFSSKYAALLERCVEEGRDPSTIATSGGLILCLDSDDTRALERRRRFAVDRGMSDEIAARHIIAGDHERVIDGLRQWEATGVDRIALTLIEDFNYNDVQPFAERVLGKFS